MATANSHISWCDGTHNSVGGCSEVSAGCAFCYAKYTAWRMSHHPNDRISARYRGTVSKSEAGKIHWTGLINTHAAALNNLAFATPKRDPDGTQRPYLCFSNSMSDWFHPNVPSDFRDAQFDAYEARPGVIWQILTKRPDAMSDWLARRYGNTGIPPTLWFGTSSEDNRVTHRLDTLRGIKDRVGDFCAFASVEPIVGAIDAHDYTGIDWVLLGGGSGKDTRECKAEWIGQGIANARRAGAAIWFKQWGRLSNNPLAGLAPSNLGREADRLQWLFEHGHELRPEEKGGATFEGRAYNELPRFFDIVRGELNAGGELPL